MYVRNLEKLGLNGTKWPFELVYACREFAMVNGYGVVENKLLYVGIKDFLCTQLFHV